MDSKGKIMMQKNEKYFYTLCVVFSITVLTLIYYQWYGKYSILYVKNDLFKNFNNVTGTSHYIVPNTVHYVLFGKHILDFTTFLSMVSVLKVQHPEKLIIHTDSPVISGYYWSVLNSIPIYNTSLEVRQYDMPTHVFGQPLSSIYHASDVARIQILMQYGGIYLDTDVLVLRSLDRFRFYEMVVGWPKGQNIGTQVIIAHKAARLLYLWMSGYKKYHPREWYYNAGLLPTEILTDNPGLVHRETHLFGVENLSSFLYGLAPWHHWKFLYTIHLLSRHPPAPKIIDEFSILHSRTPFDEMARWLLYKLEPTVKFPDQNQSVSFKIINQ